jgi:hypothetical protein
MNDSRTDGRGEENSQLKAESDALRRHLMEKKAQILALEPQAKQYEELHSSLVRLIHDFQSSGGIGFVALGSLESPFEDAGTAVPILRSGIDRFIQRHMCLATRFELEFRRGLVGLVRTLHEAESTLERERRLLHHEKQDKESAERIVEYLSSGKSIVMRTVLLRRSHQQRRSVEDLKATTEAAEALDQANRELSNSCDISEELDVHLGALTSAVQAQRTQMERQRQQHAELERVAEELSSTLKRESHSHNCSLSALDGARQRLEQLMRTIESYHDNLKTQELLDAEHENRKLHAVINNDKASLLKAKEAVVAKGKESEAQIAVLSEKVNELSHQIMEIEQKLQTQMVRIPDFDQLRQALDRLLAKSRKHRDEVMQQMYMLEEIRDRNRVVDMIEIQESLDRQAQLRQLMPLAKEIKEESEMPRMLSVCREQQADIEELLTEPGFWYREIGGTS